MGKGRGLQLQHNNFKLNTDPLLTPHCEGLDKTNETGCKTVYDHSKKNSGIKCPEVLERKLK